MSQRNDHPKGFTYAPEGPPQVGDILFFPISGETIRITDVSGESLRAVEFHTAARNYGAEHLRPVPPPALPSKTVELFWNNKGVGAIDDDPGNIDWVKAPGAFRKLLGNRGVLDIESATLYANEWIGKVAYTWGIASATGASFRTYQLPGVTDEEVAEAHRKIKADRDVVGKIRNVKISELVDFDCPRNTPYSK